MYSQFMMHGQKNIKYTFSRRPYSLPQCAAFLSSQHRVVSDSSIHENVKAVQMFTG